MTLKKTTIEAQCLPILFSTKIFPTMANNKIEVFICEDIRVYITVTKE